MADTVLVALFAVFAAANASVLPATPILSAYSAAPLISTYSAAPLVSTGLVGEQTVVAGPSGTIATGRTLAAPAYAAAPFVSSYAAPGLIARSFWDLSPGYFSLNTSSWCKCKEFRRIAGNPKKWEGVQNISRNCKNKFEQVRNIWGKTFTGYFTEQVLGSSRKFQRKVQNLRSGEELLEFKEVGETSKYFQVQHKRSHWGILLNKLMETRCIYFWGSVRKSMEISNKESLPEGAGYQTRSGVGGYNRSTVGGYSRSGKGPAGGDGS
ncbi:hypothetical protein NQ315_007041 [Exocentrus adspersus]|uniref:Uncharacterized protein n=1 Tax=Exocentrus adspersus TaxID=1586481 RepID=A0AAV8WCD4_9CUCU|nr:hypothetical protein NQ315_007041 [Exocentrus adspersus]